ncbi:hypothetical protein GF376_03710, partial [Candidatus Peregrinibacteria bacterium]|nr:hypothetical protein [Candidatus Peregrinibacteria bacterium]
MKKTYNNHENLVRDHKYWRLVEMIPGILAWGAFLGVIIGSIFNPFITANIIIVYTLIWVFRSFFFSYHLAKSYSYSKKAQKIDWKAMVELIEKPEKIDNFHHKINKLIFKNKVKDTKKELIKIIDRLKKNKSYLKPSEIIHCIAIPTYKESYEVIRTSVASYAKSNFNLKKVILMINFEERDKANAEVINEKIKAEFGHKFRDYIATFHPPNLPNENPGRAANATWGAKKLKAYLNQNNISYDKVILSSFDADTVISPDYFNELTFRYCITENRVEVGYQPVPFYYNNFWDVPIFNRLVAVSCSFWQWSVSLRKDENKSFSSRAMSFQSVLDFGYWDTSVVQDDSRQYWTAFFVYDGRHYLENIYSPIYMDAVQSEKYSQTVIDQYKQMRRWAWGASDLPFIVFNIFNKTSIGLWKKIYEIFHFIESI